MEHELSRNFGTTPAQSGRWNGNCSPIGAAMGKLGNHAPSLCPATPWRNLRGIENWVRPQDDRLDVERVWITLIGDLPPLTASLGRVLSERPGAARKVTGPVAGL